MELPDRPLSHVHRTPYAHSFICYRSIAHLIHLLSLYCSCSFIHLLSLYRSFISLYLSFIRLPFLYRSFLHLLSLIVHSFICYPFCLTGAPGDMRVRVGGAIVTLECSSDKRSLFACLLAFTLPLVLLFVFLSSSDETRSRNHEAALQLATPIDQSLLMKSRAREDTDQVKVQRQRHPPATTEEPEMTTGTLRMAMDAAASKRDLILSDHWKLIAEQKRAPDSRYNINVTRSDLIPPDRPVTDTRPASCLRFKYDLRRLPTVTVIIPYYNEALSMILRTVHSVLNRSPDQLLEEVK